MTSNLQMIHENDGEFQVTTNKVGQENTQVQ